jgi:putative NIF3 family GTP cyclohydrolase 1 type 2
LGDPRTNPTIGSVGQFERVDEVRIETVVGIQSISSVVRALRAAHPYEEPAFDLQRLAGDPTRPVGIGRIGTLPGEATVEMIGNLLKRAIGVDHLLLAGSSGLAIDRVVGRVAVCAGACGGELLSEAISQGADLYVTGEMRHHDALRAVRSGTDVICTLHSHSERLTLTSLATRLSSMLPDVVFNVSKRDRDPLLII